MIINKQQSIKYLGLIICLLLLRCISRQTINSNKYLAYIDTLTVSKKIEMLTIEPTENDPIIEVREMVSANCEKVYFEDITYRKKLSIWGWTLGLSPSLLFGTLAALDTTRSSQYGTIIGLDVVGVVGTAYVLSGQMGYDREKTKEPFLCKYTGSDTIEVSSRNNNSFKDNCYTNNITGISEFDLRNYVRASTIDSDVTFQFGLIKDQIEPLAIMVKKDLLLKLKQKEDYEQSLLNKANNLYYNGKYTEAIPVYNEIINKYNNPDVVREAKAGVIASKIKISDQKMDKLMDKLKNMNLDFLIEHNFDETEIYRLTILLNEKLGDDVRMAVVIEGLGMNASNPAEVWNAYNKLSTAQKLYAILKTVEKAVGNEPFYKKQMLKEWLFYSDLAEKLSYVKSSELISN